MLKELLEFADKHAKVVIAALAAIVVTGSISGGLWIESLQSALEQRDLIHDQRVQQMTESHAQELSEQIRDLGRAREANTVLSAQFKMVEEKARQLAPVYDRLAKAIGGLDAKTSRARAGALAEVRSANLDMGTAVIDTTHALERANDTRGMIQTLALASPVEAKVTSVRVQTQISPSFMLSVALAIILLGIIVLYIYKRFRAHGSAAG